MISASGRHDHADLLTKRFQLQIAGEDVRGDVDFLSKSVRHLDGAELIPNSLSRARSENPHRNNRHTAAFQRPGGHEQFWRHGG